MSSQQNFLVKILAVESKKATDPPDLYVRFLNGVANLKSPSIALLDQVRAIDISRIVAYRGSLTHQQYEAIAESLQKIMQPE